MDVASTGSLCVQRTFHAERSELYRAFADAQLLRRWFQPLAGIEADVARADARVGGSFALEFPLPGGERLAIGGTYRELVADERVAFELVRRTKDCSRSSQVRVELLARDGATTLTLRHDGVPDDERADVEAAWGHCLGRLAGACEQALDGFYARLERQPRFQSRFGGFWPDLSDATTRIAGKEALGVLDAADAERFRHWQQNGYVVLPGAVAPDLVDRFRAEIARDWERGNPDVTIEVCDGTRAFERMQPRYRDRPHKVLDYHSVSAVARDVQFAPAIRRFLGLLFERPPMAFQSLLFRWGTEQAMHQDTAYVVVCSPMEFVGVWIALEDVAEGSGELQYYEGSHRIPEYLWFGRARARPPEFDDDREFLRWVKEQSEQAGCPLRRFRPKKGDALVWHADLVHGGAPRTRRDETRWSLVTHFCPVDVDPEWMGRVSHSGRREHAPGRFYCHVSPGQTMAPDPH